jgi:hypothetical protein
MPGPDLPVAGEAEVAGGGLRGGRVEKQREPSQDQGRDSGAERPRTSYTTRIGSG